MSLRLRLFLSHTIVIVVALAVLSVTLLILLIEYQQRLMIREISFVATTLVRGLRVANVNNNIDQTMQRLSQVGQTQQFQILLLDSQGTVLKDSGFDAQQSIVGQQMDISHRINAAGDTIANSALETIAQGDFRDAQKRRWIFVAVAIRPLVADTNWMAIARPALSGPLINLLGESLTLPFVEAGAVALLLAAIMAAISARAIARPVQKVAAGANAIAMGKYDQRVDVSGPREIKQLADDFNRMAARVQTAQKMERDFVSNVSHELKTPLTSIKGFAQAIQDGAVNDSQSTQGAARIISDEADRMTRLVTTLLDSARLETGEVKMNMSSVSINEIAQSCITKLTPRAQTAGITIIAKMADVPNVKADGDRIAQVVTNLLDNAIKHTESGGKVTAESKWFPASKTQPDGVEFSVTDTGSGIPAEDIPRIFERFYQVDKARAQHDSDSAGTGLGLAICKQIVDAHHGSIGAQSVLGIGTRISVWLPA